MGTVYARGEKLWLGFKDSSGKWRYKAAGFAVGQEKQAEKLLKQIETQVEAEQRFATSDEPTKPRGPVTLRMFTERWLKDRERRRIRDVTNDRGRLTKHVLPVLGDTPIADLRPRHMRDLVRGWRANEQMAPRTLRKVYGTLHTLCRDAVIDELIEHTPCVLSSKELGPNEDKDPEWRATAVYDRDELIKLISSDALPQDRRMMYALMGLAGLRHGEMAGLHWRNYDPTREPLGW
jgi:integrase